MIQFFEFLNACSAYRAAAYMFFTLVITSVIFTSVNTIINNILRIIKYKIDSKYKDEKQ